MSEAIKRSSRPIRITQRLAESIKQQESFSRKESSKENEGRKKETLAQALKRKRENVEKVLKDIDLDIQKNYTLRDLRVMDGPELAKLFSRKDVLLNGSCMYTCCFDPKSCSKVFMKGSGNKNYVMICGHLLQHVLTHSKESLINPQFYHKKVYYPTSNLVSVKQEIVESGFPAFQADSPKKCSINNVKLSNLPESNGLFSPGKSKEALLNAISLRRSTNGLSPKKQSKRVNTRLNRKKVSARKKEFDAEQQRQELLERFKNQPKVVVEDFAKNKSYNPLGNEIDQRVSVADFLSKTAASEEEEMSEGDENVDEEVNINSKEDTDDESDIAADSDSTDSEAEHHKPVTITNTKTLLASLPAKKPKLSPIQSRMKHVPSILRRVRNSTNTVLKKDQKNWPGIKIESYTSLNGNDKDSIINVVDTEDSTQDTSNRKPNEENKDDGDSESDMASDSSVWCSDSENSSVEEQPKRMPRKQKLVEIKEEFDDNRILLSYIQHDHCYISFLPQNDTISFDDKKQFKTLGTLQDSLSRKANHSLNRSKSAKKEVIKVMTRNQSVSDNEYRLRGPSSKKIEIPTDPKIKAHALKLIAELRHRKPKEVMVCTERIVGDGKSSFIVQDFYSCEICGKRFTAPNSLYGHYRGHAGIKPFRCDVCGKTFTRSHSLSYHAMIHTNSARFECEYCKRKFRHPTHYKEHLHRHTGEEPYHCTDCPRRFKTRNTYRRHMIAKHNKKITPMSAVAYNSKVTLPTHQ